MVSLTEPQVCGIISSGWGLVASAATPLPGGMNSACWAIHGDDDRWVLKVVPVRQAGQFRAGLECAARLAGAGIAAGAPLPTVQSSLVLAVQAVGVAALLTWVPGGALTGDTADEQTAMAKTLTACHIALQTADMDCVEQFHWVDSEAAHLRGPSWLAPAVRAAVATVDAAAGQLTAGVLHSDPAPEAFRQGSDGSVGLIDWASAVRGPLLYDVASAVMYLGGPANAVPFVDTYAASGPLRRTEIDSHLALMLRFRWAVQADYFARRIATDDLTGIASRDDNDKGLADARRGLGV